MKRENQIKQIAMEYAENIPQTNEEKQYCMEDFIAGAKWADAFPKTILQDYINKATPKSIDKTRLKMEKEQWVNKACKWFEKELFNLHDYVCSVTANSVDEFINDFKKAMKGGEE